MGVNFYEENGVQLWRVYVHVRSRVNRKVRSQKAIEGIETREEAERLFKREYQRCVSDVARRENEGLTWREVLGAWDEWYRRYPSERWDEGTIRDYIRLCYNWTEEWLDKPASKLTITDGFRVIEDAKIGGASVRLLYQIRTTVNVIFKWGIQAGKIVGRETSPLHGVELSRKPKDILPEILSRDQIAELLHRAERAEHEWYPYWKVDAYTGLRVSELDGLRKEDVELVTRDRALELDASTSLTKDYGKIRVQRQWVKRLKRYGPTKARYWRTVPISSQLYWFLVDYIEQDFGRDDHGRRLFPLLPELQRGEAAKVLRGFCVSEKLQPIKFHTLRACFATHMLAAGVPEAKVMKIGGWKDRETMMIYVRLSGIDEAGATEVLDLKVRHEPEIEEGSTNVVSLFRRG